MPNLTLNELKNFKQRKGAKYLSAENECYAANRQNSALIPSADCKNCSDWSVSGWIGLAGQTDFWPKWILEVSKYSADHTASNKLVPK